MALDMVAAPLSMTNAQRRARYYAAHHERVNAAKAKHRHDASKWATDAAYLARPFVAWDGEGVTSTDGIHRYVMLAVKSSNGDSDYLSNIHGLGTAEAFEFILDFATAHSADIHTIYGGGYDWNMMMRDIPQETVSAIYHDKFAVWQNYRIGWRPGKSFYLSRIGEDRKTVGKGVTIYDVVSFFQCPFVKACDDYLGDKFTNREMIVANKALRSSFTLADIDAVRVYNAAELDNLLALMAELRARLNKCGLRPRRWDGPGAVAAALLMREGVKSAKGVPPAKAAHAARFAYAGGRFEVIRFGHVETPVYEYDINSAYPSALRDVPDLSDGHWTRVVGDPGPQPFALYHVEYHGRYPALPGAFFRRDPNGTVCYPLHVTGWYWSPEVTTGREYCARGYGEMSVLEAWVYTPATDRKPFTFIEPLYNKRRALKLAGDGAHVGIKLALNSLYGKLAQQIGWERKPDGTLRLPPFHQLEWAGYTTAWCRAFILRACLDKLETVIAFETDAVFTSEPLTVTLGSGLGDFELKVFDSLTYVQSGMYFATSEGAEIVKTRGVDRCKCAGKEKVCQCGSLTRARVLDKLAEPKVIDRMVEAHLTRFIGAGVALSQSWGKWRTWEVMVKHMTLEPTGKRLHMSCGCMAGNPAGIVFGIWHATKCPLLNNTHSSAFPIEWVNPDPAMSELDEMRRVENDYE